MALSVGFGALVAIGVGAQLTIGYVSTQRTTIDLVRDRAVSTMDTFLGRVRQYLQPAMDQSRFLVERLEDGSIDPTSPRELAHSLSIALAGTPQVDQLAFLMPDLTLSGVRRVGKRLEAFTASIDAGPRTEAALTAIRQAAEPFWGGVERDPSTNLAALTLRAPVRRDGQFLGALVSTISIIDLSRLLAELNLAKQERAFLLYGRDFVLAHPANVLGVPPTKDGEALPRVADFGDPVLTALWDDRKSRLVERRGNAEARLVEAPGGQRLVLFQPFQEFGPQPWIVGGQFLVDEFAPEFKRLDQMLYAGLAVLGVAVGVAALLGRRIARPIRRLAESAERIGRLDLTGLKPLPASPFREIDSAARAFDKMTTTLRWVETYLPRRLVRQLMRRAEGVASEEREVTVLFTDIIGFTALSEHRTAGEMAQMLNEHFSLVEACIDAEGGTLDKYIGDSVMAFWNAPDRQPDHAARACRAAVAMARTMEEDCQRRRAKGQAVLRMRIGIHTGPALVGNIGAPGRINYTIVGDTVNAAQRLQALGRRFDDGVCAVVALASAETAHQAENAVPMTTVGLRGLAGREKPIEVFRLA